MPRRSLLLALAWAAGCRGEGIEVYRVSKGPPGEPAAATADRKAPEAGDLRWRAPPSWRERPAGGMRRASYAVPGPDGEGDLSIALLPGDAGGALANVNRWRGQIALGPLSEAELGQASARFVTPAGEALLIDFTGSGRVLGAILPEPGRTWFFKLSGTARSVGEARGDFEGLLRSLAR